MQIVTLEALELKPGFYIIVALLIVMLVLLWRWYLKKSARTGTETFFVVMISAIGLAPLLFVLYLLFVARPSA